jgi:predicted thioredoxin/glutaredoxin
MKTIDSLIKKWKEELDTTREIEQKNASYGEYLTAHKHQVCRLLISDFIKDLKHLNEKAEKEMITENVNILASLLSAYEEDIPKSRVMNKIDDLSGIER